MGTKAVVLLAMLWLWPISVMAYPMLLTLNDLQVSPNKLSKEDRILKHYAEILQRMALRVPSQDTHSKEQAITVSSNGKNKIKEAPMAIPEEIVREIPGSLTSHSSKSNKRKPEVSLMKEPAWLKSSIRHPREQEKKDHERIVNVTTQEAPDNMENMDKDMGHLDTENMNLEHDDSSLVKTDESDSEEDTPEEKAVVSILELAVKLAVDSFQEPSKKILEKLIFKPLVKEAPKQVAKKRVKVHRKSSLDSALKLIEEASQQVKKEPGKKVILGQMHLVAPSDMDYLGTQVPSIGKGISQSSEEDKDQTNKEQVVEDLILKKISDINTKIKHVLNSVKHHMEFKADAESAKKYLIQSLSLAEGENTSSNA